MVFPYWIIETADIYIFDGHRIPKNLESYLRFRNVDLSDVSYIALVRTNVEIPEWMQFEIFAPAEMKVIEGDLVYNIVVAYHS